MPAGQGTYFFTRHAGLVGGYPLVKQLLNRECSADDPPEYLHVRHVGLAGNGLPLSRCQWECCDAYCPDVDDTSECYVEGDCWPFGPGPGITRNIYAYLDDFVNATSARRKKVKLVYDDAEEAWFSEESIPLRNGNLGLEFRCLGFNVGTEEYEFELTWSCGGTGFTILSEIQCVQPLRLFFFDLVMEECLECWGGSVDPADPLTAEPPQVGVTIVANCVPYRFMRHAGLVGPAEGPKYPLMRKESPCTFDQGDPSDCFTCGINAEITDQTGTTSMEGTFPLDWNIGFGDDKWHARDWGVDPTYGFPPGGGTGLIEVACEKRPYNPSLHEHEFRFTVRVMCQTGTGQDQTGFVDVPASEIEDLDAYVDLTFPPITETEPGVFEPNCVNNETVTDTVIRVRLLRP